LGIFVLTYQFALMVRPIFFDYKVSRQKSRYTIIVHTRHSIVYIIGLVIIAVVVVGVLGWQSPAKSPAMQFTPRPSQSTFNKSLYSTTNPTSIWVVVNKQHPLSPIDYAPTLTVPTIDMKTVGMQVATTMAPALERLFAAAKQVNLPLQMSSGYRSYAYQQTVYASEVQGYGQAEADQESARPGYSEHQTGLAADVAPASGLCALETCFGTTPQGKWVAENAYKYGFIVRYGENDSTTTGYEYEPWHIRYVGVSLATQLHNESNPSLETFFGISGGPNYN
jgi:D-alanyl-D-alanine carboxypeptidase